MIEADVALGLLPATSLRWDAEALAYLAWRARGGPAGPGRVTHGNAPARGPHGLSMYGEWRAAADAWERIGCPYERAEALADGDVPAMEEALQSFLTLGASPAADRVRQALRRAGVPRLRRGPHSTTRAHPAGLTQRESEILDLLAQHLTNADVGERLFVSAKTVEHHVSAIMGKLEVDTREEAVIAARRRGWFADPAGAPAK